MAETNNPTDDTISTGTITKAVADFARFLFRSVDFVRSSIWAHKIRFLKTCLLFISLAFLSSKMEGRYYKTEMIVQQSRLAKKTYHGIISNPFTGSYVTNLAEYVIWILVFSSPLFPEFNSSNLFASTRQPALFQDVYELQRRLV